VGFIFFFVPKSDSIHCCLQTLPSNHLMRWRTPAMRPASGQGGSMAFEDSVMLCRALANAKSQGTLNVKAGIQRALGEFENSRIPRVRKIWVDQWERAEMAYYNNKQNKKQLEPWSDDYRAWIYSGV
jgi:2-polyprenyl-6-methoxyphenol hydroxylase-like FAD-dependent oxidoreductase